MNGTSLQELMELGGWKSYEMVSRVRALGAGAPVTSNGRQCCGSRGFLCASIRPQTSSSDRAYFGTKLTMTSASNLRRR